MTEVKFGSSEGGVFLIFLLAFLGSLPSLPRHEISTKTTEESEDGTREEEVSTTLLAKTVRGARNRYIKDEVTATVKKKRGFSSRLERTHICFYILC